MEMTFVGLLIIAILAWIVARLVICSKSGSATFANELKLFGFFAYIMLLVRGVYFPFRSPDGRLVRMVVDFEQILPFNINYSAFTFLRERYPGWWINVFGNIAVFIPMGILMPFYFKKLNSFWKTLLAGFGVSLFIEISQLALYDRCSDVDDLILNTTGAALGAVIYFIVRKVKQK